MRVFPLLALLFAATSHAQTTSRSALIVSDERFAPDSKVETVESSSASGPSLVESGTLNGVSYRFFYSDGSGTFAGTAGNTLQLIERERSNWRVRCTKDPITDKKHCLMSTRDLWIVVDPRGAATVSIGSQHFPGSSVTIRTDGGQPFSTNARNDGEFDARTSATIVARLKGAKVVTTRYMAWPRKSWSDETWDLYGFNEALKYITWAAVRIR